MHINKNNPANYIHVYMCSNLENNSMFIVTINIHNYGIHVQPKCTKLHLHYADISTLVENSWSTWVVGDIGHLQMKGSKVEVFMHSKI